MEVLTLLDLSLTGPNFSDLMKKFESITDWDLVYPFLVNDVDGQKTKQIKKKENNINDRCAEMLQEFLRQPHPTWRDVVEALRAGNHGNLADEIERDLQG